MKNALDIIPQMLSTLDFVRIAIKARIGTKIDAPLFAAIIWTTLMLGTLRASKNRRLAS